MTESSDEEEWEFRGIGEMGLDLRQRDEGRKRGYWEDGSCWATEWEEKWEESDGWNMRFECVDGTGGRGTGDSPLPPAAPSGEQSQMGNEICSACVVFPVPGEIS